VVHGGGGGSFRMWREVDTVVCEVSDAGHVSDPLAGRVLVPSDAEGGRGLWLVNQCCDLVELRSSPSGTVVRLHVARTMSATGR